MSPSTFLQTGPATSLSPTSTTTAFAKFPPTAPSPPLQVRARPDIPATAAPPPAPSSIPSPASPATARGNLYIADVGNQRIRKVDSSGNITTLAGNGVKGYGGDGGPATSASFYNPVRVALDPSGNVLVADQSNHRIRLISPSGTISTIAGNGVGTPAAGAFSGDGGPAVNASLNNPTALTVDSAGVIYFSDQFNQRIRKFTEGGIINTIAGNGNAGFSGDGGPATSASLNYPGGITVDSAGNLYVNDDLTITGTRRTRRQRHHHHQSQATAIRGFFPATADPLPPPPSTVTSASPSTRSGNLYIADSMNNRIREALRHRRGRFASRHPVRRRCPYLQFRDHHSARLVDFHLRHQPRPRSCHPRTAIFPLLSAAPVSPSTANPPTSGM